MLKRAMICVCVLALMVGLYAFAAAADAASAVAAIGTRYFDTWEAAVAAVDEANPELTVITLKKDLATVEVAETIYLDLAGKNIATVSVAEDATVYCLDSETDDYVIEGDETNGYTGFGRIAEVTGEGKVAGVEAGMIPVPASDEYLYGCLDGYLMVEEAEKGFSFHRVNLQIKSMFLRAKDEVTQKMNPGVYYRSAFGGDALVAQQVETFGVALSATEEPNAYNMGSSSAYSWFEGENFVAGENNNDATSTLLSGVMKVDNADIRNKANSNIPVYGRAYVKTADGYVFGVCADRTLKQLTEAADTYWDDYFDNQKTALTDMYDTYFKIMETWSVPNILEGYEDKEAKVLKVLTLGHSLGLDSNHMLNLVAENMGHTGYEEMVIGSLYYSGCPLWRHAKNLYENTPEYTLNLSSTADPTQPLKSIGYVTIAFAIDYDYWDIIIMQGGVWEIGQDDKYTDGNIQIIQDYIEKNKRNPELYMGWNMTWCPPVDDDLTNDSYVSSYTKNFNRDRDLMYSNIVRCVQTYIATDDHYKFIVPSATIFENALTSYLTEKDIHRDYVHATDLSRLMVSHAFYCRIFGIEQLDEILVDVVPTAFFKTHKVSEGDWVLTDEEKALILEAVNNALKTPYEVTQSQHTAG